MHEIGDPMNKRLILAAAASAVALATVAGVAVGARQDEPRLVWMAGESAPVVEAPSTTSSSPETGAGVVPGTDGAAKVTELDATVDDHETRISRLEATTTTTAPPNSPIAPTVPTTEPISSPSTTIPDEPTEPTTTTTTAAPPTTTTTRFGPPWWCLDATTRNHVPCDSTTTTSFESI